jgi:hypothetical protein
MAARGLVIETDPQAVQMPKGYWDLVAAMLPDMFQNAQAAKDAAKGGLKMEIAYISTPIGNLYLKDGATAFAKAGTRGWLAVRIDPAKLDAIGQVAELRDICLPAPAICEETAPEPIVVRAVEPIRTPPGLVPVPMGFGIGWMRPPPTLLTAGLRGAPLPVVGGIGELGPSILVEQVVQCLGKQELHGL